MKKIVWLASYPKSGNTWFRAFLANLLRNSDKPVDINELDTGGIASARIPLDLQLGYDSANLTHEEIDRLRREYYLRRASEDGATLFLKVHDAHILLNNGLPLFPPEVSHAVLYFVRNPLDVCVSFAHHSGRADFDRTLVAMGKPNYAVAGNRGRFHDQLRQRMLSWSGHVRSWADAPGHRVHVMRYEDMKLKTEETFTEAVRFADLPGGTERINKAIRFSRFEELRGQEQKAGFRERVHADSQFFRKGKIGSWREELSVEQVEQIVRDHGEVMKRFGYLSENGNVCSAES